MTVWLESQGTGTEPEWRWRVVHVQTGKESYLRGLSDVVAFISLESGAPGPE